LGADDRECIQPILAAIQATPAVNLNCIGYEKFNTIQKLDDVETEYK